MGKNKKILLFLVGLLILFYILINIILNLPSGKKYNGTIFIGSYTKVEINNKNIKVYNEDMEISRQKVKVYFRDSFIDGYIFSKKSDTAGIENIYIITNESGEYISVSSPFIAYTGDLTIKVKELNTNTINDIDVVYKFAEENNIVIPKKNRLDKLIVSNVDIDDDGVQEYIYSAGLIEGIDRYETFIFMKKDDKYILIDKEDSNYNGVEYVNYIFTNLVDFNNDGEYEFVVRKSESEYDKVYYDLFNFKDNKFIKVGGK